MTTNQIIRQIAKEHGVTPQEVKADIKKVIREAMILNAASNNTVTKKLWQQISPIGKEPSIEEFLKFCTSKVSRQIFF